MVGLKTSYISLSAKADESHKPIKLKFNYKLYLK